ncbi:MAG TPA: HAMP domain-containing sensor histidine kinase [Gaiellaceae bacterium]
MTWLALVVAGASLGVSLVVATLLRRAPAIGLQLAGLAFLSVCVPLVAVLLSGWVMFHMGDDVKILAVAAASATAAVVAGLVLARAIAFPIGRLASVARTIAGGDLSTRADEGGPRELRELAVAFNEMAGSVERLFDVRRDLVSWASHDLRTPLASLQALLEAAEDGVLEPDEYLPAMRGQTASLVALVDDLFELARVDAGALAVELRRVELDRLVSSAMRVVAPQAAARDVRLDRAGDVDAAVVAAPDQLERVLVNLVSNAIRHTPPAGAVAVRVERAGDEVHIHVEDTGEGLDEETQRRMFDRFWRGDRARSGGGAGLGLVIAKALVEAHGGAIWAENRVPAGARVSFSLRSA